MKAIGKLIKWAILLALVIPVGYFAIRMGQPMEQPEYKGLTYYQYLEWEHMVQEEHLEEYYKNNPSAEETKRFEKINSCGVISFAFGHMGRFFSQPLNIIVASVMEDKPFDVLHFLPNWWSGFEVNHLKTLEGNSNRHPICRTPSVIPDDYALSVGAKLPQ